MDKISVEELIKYKMLPFDLYNENGEKLISAGEILTSGKLFRINQCSELFIDTPQKSFKTPKPKPIEHKPAPKQEKPKETPKKPVYQDDRPKEIIIDRTVNKVSRIKQQAQVDMKSYFATTVFAIQDNAGEEAAQMVHEIKSKILTDVSAIIEDVKFCSELKLLGNYTDTHSLNTAILATAFGFKLEWDEDVIAKITQSAILHDIGMLHIPQEIIDKINRSSQETKIFQTHTQIGYRILKHDMKMPEDICLVALEHHENNDGSGYPFQFSGEQISKMSMIVGMCSYFDDLTSGKTPYKIKNTKEALRVMLEVGSRRFFPELLYKFVNIFNYNDLKSFDDMVQ